METVGAVHRSVEKLLELPTVLDDMSAVVVCATEDAVFCDALIEKISESLDRSDGTFASAKDAVEDATLDYCSKVWKALKDSQDKPTAEMLIGLRTADDLRLLHLSTPTVRIIEACEFIGYGRELGIYKAGQYGLKGVPTETAAPIIAYIVDIVKNNIAYCGRSTNLAILHADGNVEHKSQEYIAKTTQGYKSLGWLLDTWVFPFLPLIVSETGEDVLSRIGELGEPKTEWVQKIPGILQFLKARKQSILAGEIPAIPEDQKRKVAVAGLPTAARMIVNSVKGLHAESLISDELNDSISARYTAVAELSQLISNALHAKEIDVETLKESLARIGLLLTMSPSPEQLELETSEDQD